LVGVSSQRPALGGEDTGTSKRLYNVMRELSARIGVLRFRSLLARPRLKKERVGETHHEKDVNEMLIYLGRVNYS
jgi:hypothetical protein